MRSQLAIPVPHIQDVKQDALKFFIYEKGFLSETMFFTMVELTGFEPVTSSMPLKRASNCAKTPLSFIII